jgi:hypothetical protein
VRAFRAGVWSACVAVAAPATCVLLEHDIDVRWSGNSATDDMEFYAGPVRSFSDMIVFST